MLLLWQHFQSKTVGTSLNLLLMHAILMMLYYLLHLQDHTHSTLLFPRLLAHDYKCLICDVDRMCSIHKENGTGRELGSGEYTTLDPLGWDGGLSCWVGICTVSFCETIAVKDRYLAGCLVKPASNIKVNVMMTIALSYFHEVEHIPVL
jgi:hypothetical protein